MKLFDKSMDYNLVSVIAGPGYGKSEMVRRYLHEFEGKAVYMQLQKIHNVPSVFWEDFKRTLNLQYPDVKMDDTEFPESLVKFSVLYRKLISFMNPEEKNLMIFDNLQAVDSPEVQYFLQNICSLEIHNLTVMIVSHYLPSYIQLTNSVFRITSTDLSFTKDEIKAYFMEKKMPKVNDYDEILEMTTGWPLMIYLITEHGRENIELYGDLHGMELLETNNIFEECFFSQYDLEIRHLFISLALLNSFDMEIVYRVNPALTEEARGILLNNPFAIYNSFRNTFTFQKLYKEFLVNKKNRLNSYQRESLFYTAARYYSEEGNFREAIFCYSECRLYDQMAIVIQNLLENLPEDTRRYKYENFQYYIGLINTLPSDVLDRYPYLWFVKATIYSLISEYDKAYEVCIMLEKDLLSKTDTQSRELLGEIYLLLAEVLVGKCSLGILDCQIKADKLLPNGSRFTKKSFLAVGNNSAFYLPIHKDPKTGKTDMRNPPGTVDALVAEFLEAEPYMSRLMHGFTSGLSYLMAAEAAYETGDFDRAREMAYKSIYAAKVENQHDIYCNAYIVLSKLSLANGDLNSATHNVNEIKTIIEKNRLKSLYDLRDCLVSWFEITIGNPENCVEWIKKDISDNKRGLQWYTGRDMRIHAYYLLATGQYVILLSYLQTFSEKAEKLKLWISLLNIHIIKAICYYKSGDFANAIEAFYMAYQMSYDNNIIMPFIEMGRYIRSLLIYIKNLDDPRFDNKWVEKLHKRSSTNAKRLISLKRENTRLDIAPSEENAKLSEKETEVLRALSQGLTREEISKSMKVSLGTVKKHITNVYSKLGAVNRADAIYIATGQKLL